MTASNMLLCIVVFSWKGKIHLTYELGKEKSFFYVLGWEYKEQSYTYQLYLPDIQTGCIGGLYILRMHDSLMHPVRLSGKWNQKTSFSEYKMWYV